MVNFVIISFIITLIYIAKIEMVKSYYPLMAAQGVLLFILSFLELSETSALQLILILFETLIFKAIFVPLFLQAITKGRAHRHQHSPVKGYYSLLLALALIVASFVISHQMHEEFLDVKYFTAATSSIFIGLFIAINNRDLVTHLIAYLVIENGIFLLSIALGGEMPMFVNSAILLDIFTSVLIMGLVFNRLKDHFESTDATHLSQLKD